MEKKAELSFQEEKNRLLIEKVSKFFEELGIANIKSSAETDGIHFFIPLPKEHVEARIKQAQQFGSLDPTQFDREVVIPFAKHFRVEYGEYFELQFLSGSITRVEKEFVVSDKKI